MKGLPNFMWLDSDALVAKAWSDALKGEAMGLAVMTELPLVIGQAVKHSRKRHAGNSTMQLTARQLEILRLIARHLQSKEIARLLSLSPKTVESYRSRIMAKLDVHDVPALVRLAIREGLISADDA